MTKWLIEEQSYDPEHITGNGNRFFCGNGYMGIRGTMEEYRKEHLPAVNLAGIYDRVGDGWREPLNAPNPLYTRLQIDGERYELPVVVPERHMQWLDFQHGVTGRRTVFHTKRGSVTIEAEHLAHYTREHLLLLSYTVTADYHAEIELITGIDADVWDIHGPHYDKIERGYDCRAENVASASHQKQTSHVTAVTHEKQELVAVMEQSSLDYPCEIKKIETDGGQLSSFCYVSDIQIPVTLTRIAAVVTSQDTKEPVRECEALLEQASEMGFAQLLQEHKSAWESFWNAAEVTIDGDEQAGQALNYSMYHLQCIAPRYTQSQSIPARGLSGQTYKGAVFWDTEMFMLDYYLNTDPATARTLMKYRIDTLDGAEQKARQYGFQGAFYAWESQEGGFDACSDYNVTDVFTNRPMRTYFKDKQIHISAAIVYGLMHYGQQTGDDSLLREGGARVVIECARFYDSLLVQRRHGEGYELWDVIGPDEYHERVNNNVYTNRMAKYTFDMALEVLEKCDSELSEKADDMSGQDAGQLKGYDLKQLKEMFAEDAEKLYRKKPDERGLLEQFDGYFRLEDVSVSEVRSRLLNPKEYWGGAYGVASGTQVIKQADVVAALGMFPQDYDEELLWKNWSYYEPRTEHGSSLSACMYGILACICHRPDQAYGFFMKSAQADLVGGGKEWAGNVYIGGTHPAAAGGAYMLLVRGFAGIARKNGELTISPNLPKHWKHVRFQMQFRGERIAVEICRDEREASGYTVKSRTLSRSTNEV